MDHIAKPKTGLRRIGVSSRTLNNYDQQTGSLDILIRRTLEDLYNRRAEVQGTILSLERRIAEKRIKTRETEVTETQ